MQLNIKGFPYPLPIILGLTSASIIHSIIYMLCADNVQSHTKSATGLHLEEYFFLGMMILIPEQDWVIFDRGHMMDTFSAYYGHSCISVLWGNSNHRRNICIFKFTFDQSNKQELYFIFIFIVVKSFFVLTI